MLVRIYHDKTNTQYIVSINDAESHVCRALWLDEDLLDPNDEEDDFEFIYAEARLVKIFKEVCVVETSVVEVVSDAEE